MSKRTNWAGNVAYDAGSFLQPTSVDELCSVVASTPRLRAVGTGHSFNRIADTRHAQVSVRQLPRVLELDEASHTVMVDAGARYGEFVGELHRRGWALRNMGSLPHISVAGACSTGTHGSGSTNGSLASAVAGLELVTADGDLVALHRGGADFAGAVVALGALGVVTRLTLDIVPTYDMRQWVYEDMPWDSAVTSVDAVLQRAYSVSMFTDWRTGDFGQVWVKERMVDVDGPAPQNWLGARLASVGHDPIPSMSPVNSTQQGGVPGPWYERLPHFRLEFTPSSGEELQAEYFVARTAAAAVLRSLRGLGQVLAPVLQISEIRTVAADECWLSPTHGQDSMTIHFTFIKDEAAVAPVVRALEDVLAPYCARPHWGKVFSTDVGLLGSLYPRMTDFTELVWRYDPAGKFSNDFLRTYVTG